METGNSDEKNAMMLMIWCSHNTQGMVQEECGDAMASSFSDLSKNAQY
jgi:hypothetical protein